GATASPGHSSCQRATSTSGSMSPKTGRPPTSRTGTGASSAARRSHCSASLVSPTRPTPGSSTESRNSRDSGNATSAVSPVVRQFGMAGTAEPDQQEAHLAGNDPEDSGQGPAKDAIGQGATWSWRPVATAR